MSKYNDLVKKLKEIFQIDRPELDFGIYRILNARADEINDYLDNKLKAKIQAALKDAGNANKAELEQQLQAAIKAATDAGFEPDQSPKVQDLRKQLAGMASGSVEHENAVFLHLLTFFSRYYDNGDFISKRRYKGDTYAIPYAGEEVMLHWANKDQYYIKSGENFANYAFKLDDGRKVSFKLLAADTAKDNRKDNDADRRFVLIEPHTRTKIDEEGEAFEQAYQPVEVVKTTALVNGEAVETEELVIHFEYKAMKKGTKQDALVQTAITTILAEPQVQQHWAELAKRASTESKPSRTELERHLTTYTQRNTADYFIHKDLGGFLTNELDFYIKNEVMNLDNLQNAQVFANIEKQLRMIQCLRAVAKELITFLAQIESFQKSLWTKKKLIVESNYLVSIDVVPEELYPELIENMDQIHEWSELYCINGTECITVDFVKSNKDLILDTAHFDIEFKEKLMSSISDFDDFISGELFNSDNFQALSLMKNKFNDKIKFIYIDPPYNTGGDGFFYRDSFKHSSWLSMMLPKLNISYNLLSDDGVIYASIDAVERNNLQHAFDLSFGAQNKVEEVIWAQNTTKNQSPTFSTNHEYVHVYSKDIDAVKKSEYMFRELKPGYKEVQELINNLNPDYPSVSEIEKALSDLYKAHKKELKDSELDPKDDPWKSLTNYNKAEYRDINDKYVEEYNAKEEKAIIRVWREVDTSLPQVKEDSQKEEFKDPNHPDYRFYRPLHPVTGKLCQPPKTGWRWSKKLYGRQTNSFDILDQKYRIVYGKDESKVPQQKSFLHEVATNVAKSVVNDYADGEKELRNKFGKSRAFSNPKPTTLIERFCIQSDMRDGDYAMDYFAGSGTTGDAIISLNKKDDIRRKFILVEMGEYFNSVLLPRVKKSAYSLLWDDGVPVRKKLAEKISKLEAENSLGSYNDIKKSSKALDLLRLKSEEDKSLNGFLVKYSKLESYDDTLNNISLFKKNAGLFDSMASEVADDYLLKYMLGEESKSSLLSTDNFRKPFSYEMNIATDSAGATERKTIDLVETFNFLIGLHVKSIESNIERGYVRIEGTLPTGERTLILWRDCDKIGYDKLNEYANRFDLYAKEQTFDVIYINGDHNLPTAFTVDGDDGEVVRSLKLRQIEPEFLSLMFAEEA